MKSKILKRFFHCVFIALICIFIVFIMITLFFTVHCLEAPYLLLTGSQKLGNKVGVCVVQWNGKKKTADIYTGKCLEYGRVTSCLLVYPEYCFLPFVPESALKITENSVGIFNDRLTECLPMGRKIYESSMTYPVYSVDDDMKGWNAKYEISRGKNEIKYRIYPSEYSNRNIEFAVPVSCFRMLQ